MARNVPERIKTKGGHSPRARIHAAWSPIGQKMRRTAMLRGLGAVLAVLLVIGLAADAYAQSSFDSLPSIQGLDSAAFAGDTLITDSSGKTVLADVGNHGDHRLAVKLKDVSPVAVQATVAGLPQAPTEWNPVLHPDQAKLRQTEVLRAMVRSNFISQEDMDKALAEKLNFYAPVNRYNAPHFVDYVLAELRQLGFQPGIQQLNVKTTLDWTMQQVGESTVANNMSRIACNARHSNYGCDIRGVLSSGLVAIDPHTGDIMVMVGSPNYNSDGGHINYTTIPRNMGSSMKPYTYGAVINARAATVDTPVYDGPR